MPLDYGGAAKRPIRKTWGKPKKTKENHFYFLMEVEQKKTFIQRKKCFSLFLFVFICFFFVRSFGAISYNFSLILPSVRKVLNFRYKTIVLAHKVR